MKVNKKPRAVSCNLLLFLSENTVLWDTSNYYFNKWLNGEYFLNLCANKMSENSKNKNCHYNLPQFNIVLFCLISCMTELNSHILEAGNNNYLAFFLKYF